MREGVVGDPGSTSSIAAPAPPPPLAAAAPPPPPPPPPPELEIPGMLINLIIMLDIRHCPKTIFNQKIDLRWDRER